LCTWQPPFEGVGDGFDHAASAPVLLVEYDDGDVIETLLNFRSLASRPQHRYLVSACEIGDELTYQESAGLAVLAPVKPNREFFDL